MPPLIPCFANSFQVTMSMTTKEIHIRFLALTPRVALDHSKPTEFDAIEMASVFMSEEAARSLCRNLEQSFEDFKKYDAENAEMGEKNVPN